MPSAQMEFHECAQIKYRPFWPNAEQMQELSEFFVPNLLWQAVENEEKLYKYN